MKPAPQVVHESETQRQHTRLPIPARARLEGKEYALKDLTPRGLALRDVEGAFNKGQRIALELQLPFNAFSFNLKCEAEVLYLKNKVLGCAFSNLTPEHVSVITQISNAYLAGEILETGGILSVLARNNYTKPRAQSAASPPGLGRQAPGLAAVFALGLLLCVFIFGNLYRSLFTVQATDAVVAGQLVELAAPVDGVYHPRPDFGFAVASAGQVVGTVTPAGGKKGIEIKSPCDCNVATALAEAGPVLAGTRIAALAAKDAAPWVNAAINPAGARKLKPGTRASVSIFGVEEKFTGRVENLESGLSAPDAAFGLKPAIAKIVPDRPLPPGLIGRPAFVTLRVF